MLKTNTKTIGKVFFAGIALISVLFYPVQDAKGVDEDPSISDIEAEEREANEKIKLLEQKAEKYKKAIDLKKKEQSTLNNQISIMETEIGKLESNIGIKKEESQELDGEISRTEKQIKDYKVAIQYQKKMLGNIIQVYYESKRQDVLSNFLSSNFYSLIGRGDRLLQTEGKLREIVTNINSMKNELEDDKSSMEGKKKQVEELKYDLEERSAYLESSKIKKTSLIAQTRGEEQRYQELLIRVEKQKQELLGDIDQLYNANSAELEALAASLEKPSSKYWASTSWYYSQKDSRWGDDTIGNSNSLLKDYGCALTAVAMVFTYHGERITPAAMAKKPIFYWDLISWPESSFKDKVDLVTNTNHGGVTWSTIDEEIEAGNPVIVFVSARGRAGHYVAIHNKDKKGNYVVHDPYFGANIYLDSTIKLLGKMYGTSTSINSVDQMVIYK